MTCAACRRANLAGGVRCVYCGTPFPPMPDFDLGGSAGPPSAEDEKAAPAPPRRLPPGLFAGLLFLLFKGKALLGLVKLVPVFGSMFLFIWADSHLFGWKLATGLAVSILIHELGHVVMNWRHGLKCSVPMFIPFLGAVITVKQFPADPQVEAESGAGGPAAGLLAGAAFLLIGEITGEPVWTAIALLGFGINMMNLIPFWQLDGARITSAMAPANWDFMLVVLTLIGLKAPSVLLWAFLFLLLLFRLGKTPQGRHNLAHPVIRARITGVFLVLILGLGFGLERSSSGLAYLRKEQAAARANRAAPAPRAEGGDSSARATTRRTKPLPSTPTSAPGRTLSVIDVIVGVGGLLLLLAVPLLVFGGWPLAVYWLARAAGERVNSRGRNLLAVMLGLLPVLIYVAAQLPSGSRAIFLPGLSWPITKQMATFVIAWLAASLAAVFHAGYHITHAPRLRWRHPHYWLTWRSLAWAAGAALAVAYWVEDGWLVLVVAAGALFVYGQRPWLVPALAARIAEGFGYTERAIALRRRALAMKPHAEVLGDLYDGLARAYLSLGHGERVLQVLDEAAGHGPQPEPASPRALDRDYWRAKALVRVGRYDEALARCEAILRAPAGDRAGTLRILLVREVLTELSLARDWPDEARAQAQVLLHEVPPTSDGVERELGAAARRARAQALLQEGRLDDALQEVEKALLWGREPQAEVTGSLVRAEVARLQGETERALREIRTALRRLPGHLEARYRLGRLLRETGSPEGERELGAVAAEAPHDLWGRRALEG